MEEKERLRRDIENATEPQPILDILGVSTEDLESGEVLLDIEMMTVEQIRKLQGMPSSQLVTDFAYKSLTQFQHGQLKFRVIGNRIEMIEDINEETNANNANTYIYNLHSPLEPIATITNILDKIESIFPCEKIFRRGTGYPFSFKRLHIRMR